MPAPAIPSPPTTPRLAARLSPRFPLSRAGVRHLFVHGRWSFLRFVAAGLCVPTRDPCHHGRSCSELCNLTYDVLQSRLQPFPAGIPHAAFCLAPAKRYYRVRRDHVTTADRVSGKATRRTPGTAGRPRPRSLGLTRLPSPPSRATPPLGVGHQPWAGSRPRIGFARPGARMRTPALAPNPFRSLSRHPASRRDPTSVLDTGCPGRDPETLERLPFGEATDRTARAARPGSAPHPASRRDPIPAFGPIPARLAARRPPHRGGLGLHG